MAKKRVFSIALALVLLAGLGLPALALEEDYTLNSVFSVDDIMPRDLPTVDDIMPIYELVPDLYIEPELYGVTYHQDVLVNGKYVEFEDVDAGYFYVGGTSEQYIPLRAVMEALDAEVGYEDGMITVLYGDVKVAFKAGDTVAIVVADGNDPVEYEMNPAPIYINGRTMIAPHMLTDCFGLVVAGNYDISVMDIKPLLEGLDERFTIMNKLMADSYNIGDVKYDGTYEGSVNFAMVKDADSEPDSINVPFDGSFSAANVGLSSVGKFALDLDLMELAKNDMVPQEFASVVPIIAAIVKNIEIEYIYNADEGMVYLYMPLLNILFGTTDIEWLSMDINSMYDMLSTVPGQSEFVVADYSELTFSGLIELMVRSMGDYDMAVMLINTYEALCSDECFTVTEDDGAVNYSLDFTKDDLFDMIVNMGQYYGEEIDEEELLAEFESFEFEITISYTILDEGYESSVDFVFSFELDGVSINMGIKALETFPGEMSIDMNMDVVIAEDVVALGLNLDSEDTYEVSAGFDLSIKGESAYNEEDIPAQPPEDANVMDIYELIAPLFESVITEPGLDENGLVDENGLE